MGAFAAIILLSFLNEPQSLIFSPVAAAPVTVKKSLLHRKTISLLLPSTVEIRHLLRSLIAEKRIQGEDEWKFHKYISFYTVKWLDSESKLIIIVQKYFSFELNPKSIQKAT